MGFSTLFFPQPELQSDFFSESYLRVGTSQHKSDALMSLA